MSFGTLETEKRGELQINGQSNGRESWRVPLATHMVNMKKALQHVFTRENAVYVRRGLGSVHGKKGSPRCSNDGLCLQNEVLYR